MVEFTARVPSATASAGSRFLRSHPVFLWRVDGAVQKKISTRHRYRLQGMVEASEKQRGKALAVTVCVLSTLGILSAIIASTDTRNWGAILVVGVVGTVGGIILTLLGLLAVYRSEFKGVKQIAWSGVVLSVVGIVVCQMVLRS